MDFLATSDVRNEEAGDTLRWAVARASDVDLEVGSDKLDRRQSKVVCLAHCSPPVSVTVTPDAGYKYCAKAKLTVHMRTPQGSARHRTYEEVSNQDRKYGLMVWCGRWAGNRGNRGDLLQSLILMLLPNHVAPRVGPRPKPRAKTLM